MSDPDFRALVVRMLEQSTATDPVAVSEELVRLLSPYEYGEVLREVLPSYVRIMMHRDRPSVPELERAAARAQNRPHCWSPWVEAIQNGALKKTRWWVNGEWKFFAEFDRSDLVSVLEQATRAEKSAKAKREGFERLLAVFDSRAVQTIEELSEMDIAAALSGVEVPK